MKIKDILTIIIILIFTIGMQVQAKPAFIDSIQGRTGTLYIYYANEVKVEVENSNSPAAALHFEVVAPGSLIISAFVKLNDNQEIHWAGQGSEYVDFTNCETAFWHWVLTPSNILTISNAHCVQEKDDSKDEEEDNKDNENDSDEHSGDDRPDMGNNGDDRANNDDIAHDDPDNIMRDSGVDNRSINNNSSMDKEIKQDNAENDKELGIESVDEIVLPNLPQTS